MTDLARDLERAEAYRAALQRYDLASSVVVIESPIDGRKNVFFEDYAGNRYDLAEMSYILQFLQCGRNKRERA